MPQVPVLHDAPEKEEVVGQVVVSVAGGAPGYVLLQGRPVDADFPRDVPSQLLWRFCPERVEGRANEMLEGTVPTDVPDRTGSVGVR